MRVVGKITRLTAEEPAPLDARLEELERKFDRLRGLYESFFMGVERQPPNVPRRELNRLMVELQQNPITNAGLRFRFQSLTQKWVLYTTYWNRTMREIESGTYRRDVAKAQRHLAKGGAPLTEAEALALGIPSSRVKSFVEKQAALAARRPGVPSPAAPKPTPAPAGPPPGMSDVELRRFYDRYVDARTRSADSRPALSYDQMRARLLDQAPKLLADKRVRRIDLDVVVEDGKVKVRATPVRE
jgi:hypothetical protein